jgi:branched-chain amino acid transport system substrate-binding protein
MAAARISRLRIVIALVCLAMLAAACGQKEGVHQGRQVGFAPGQGGGGGAFADDGFTDDGFDDGFAEDGSGFDDAAFDDFDAGGDAGGGTAGGTGGDAGAGSSGGTTGGGTSGGAGGGQPADAGQPAGGGGEGAQPAGDGGAQPAAGGGGGNGGGGGGNGGGGNGGSGAAAAGGGDSTGVSDNQIRIGVHAPITGAAPIPQTSVEASRQQYWNVHGPVHGREVEVIIRDDQYNPSRATSVCNELIQRQEVFLLAGVGGVDQIAACARTAAQQGVPYISSGTVEGALRQLPNYFSISMSYKQQAPLVIDWIKRNSPPSNNRFAILRDRTPNFGEVIQEMERLGQAAGWEVLVRQHQNGPSDAQWLAQNGIEVAFPIMAPSSFVQIANSPGASNVQYVGVGPTMGLNTVANSACPAIDGAVFFSSWSGLNQADRLDPSFNREGNGGDDIQWASWGQNKAMATVFEGIGRNLTREAFIQYLRTNEVETGVTPTTRHSANDNFGVREAHRLEADCGRREFVTPDDGLFVRGPG